MKKIVFLVFLVCGVVFADTYKSRLNDGIVINVKQLSERKISFEVKQNDSMLLKGTAVDKYSHIGIESDDDENGVSYLAIEYWNTADSCLASLRIQCEPNDKNDTKTRLRIVGNRDAGQKCKKYFELEYVIFFKQ